MKRKINLINRRFDNPEFAKKYAARHSKMSIKFAGKIAALLSMNNFDCGRILDSGCGSGLTIIQLAKKFPDSKFYGIDLSGPLLEIANNMIRRENLTEKVKFFREDVYLMPFKENYFDAVININMVHLVDNPVFMLNEIKRVLKTDGLFFITDLRKSLLGFLEKEIKSSLTVKEARQVIAKSNLLTGKFSSDLIWWRYQNI